MVKCDRCGRRGTPAKVRRHAVPVLAVRKTYLCCQACYDEYLASHPLPFRGGPWDGGRHEKKAGGLPPDEHLAMITQTTDRSGYYAYYHLESGEYVFVRMIHQDQLNKAEP